MMSKFIAFSTNKSETTIQVYPPIIVNQVQLHSMLNYQPVITFKEEQRVYEDDRLILKLETGKYTLFYLRDTFYKIGMQITNEGVFISMKTILSQVKLVKKLVFRKRLKGMIVF